MKYIKAYEGVNPNKRLDELKKLLSHLSDIFIQLGYEHSQNYDEYQYTNHFYRKQRENSFDIVGEFSNSLIFLAFIKRIGSLDDDLAQYIPKYFRTIKGLKLYSENTTFNNTTFEVIDNVDDIIEQISMEDIELKMDREKYNI